MIWRFLPDGGNKIGRIRFWQHNQTGHIACHNLKLKHMYEAMDLLYEHAAEVEKTIFF